MNTNRICLNVRQMSSKNYVIFWGEGGRSSKDQMRSQGGGQDGPKKDHIIFERSIIGYVVFLYLQLFLGPIFNHTFVKQVHKKVTVTKFLH